MDRLSEGYKQVVDKISGRKAKNRIFDLNQSFRAQKNTKTLAQTMF